MYRIFTVEFIILFLVHPFVTFDCFNVHYSISIFDIQVVISKLVLMLSMVWLWLENKAKSNRST